MLPGSSDRLNIARCAAYAQRGRYQFKAFMAPFSFATGRNHKPLISLNKFRVGLLDEYKSAI